MDVEGKEKEGAGAGSGRLLLPARTQERKWVVAGLLLVMVLASLEATVTSTAMPTVIGKLHGLEHYSWVASIYLLASTVTMPLYGRLSDVFGRKRVLMFSIALFAVGSVLASMSQTMEQLILFRGLQGLGAGGIMPVVMTILGDIFTLAERARIQGIFSALWGTASLAGPALGAFLVYTTKFSDYVPAGLRGMLGWPTIFWVPLPAAAAAMVMLALKYHEHREVGHGAIAGGRKGIEGQLDLRGMGLLALGASGFLVAVSLASGVTVSWWVPAGTLAVAVAAMAGFVKWERVAVNPVMPAGLMMHKSIGPSMVVSGLVGLGIFSLDTYVPLYVQGGRGGTAASAAAVVTPVMLSMSLAALAAAPLMIRWGFRKLVTIGSVLVAAGFLGLLISAMVGAPLWVLTGLLFLTGMGFALCSMGTLLGAQDAVDYRQRGIVTSGVTFFRNFGGAMGVGLFGALFNLLTARSLGSLTGGHFSAGDLLDAEKLKGIQASHPELLAKAQATIGLGLLWVFGGMVFLALVMIVISRKISAKKHEGKVSLSEVMEAVA